MRLKNHSHHFRRNIVSVCFSVHPSLFTNITCTLHGWYIIFFLVRHQHNRRYAHNIGNTATTNTLKIVRRIDFIVQIRFALFDYTVHIRSVFVKWQPNIYCYAFALNAFTFLKYMEIKTKRNEKFTPANSKCPWFLILQSLFEIVITVSPPIHKHNWLITIASLLMLLLSWRY